VSRFDTMFKQAAPSFFERLGTGSTTTTSVRYVEAYADPVNLKAIISPIESDEEETDTGRRTIARRRRAVISLDPASELGGVASPKASAHLVIDGSQWAIEAVTNQSAGFAELMLRLTTAVEVASSRYRGKP